MNETQGHLVYLLYCAVNGIVPDKTRVQEMDLDQLYELAKRHSVEAAVYVALHRADITDGRFYQDYNKSIARNLYLDIERKSILADLEKDGIWYMPLKGAILKELYPKAGMRQMSDNDILFDPSRQSRVREIMEAHGYRVRKYGRFHHDEYYKPPVMYFEMHLELFGTDRTGALYQYFADTGRLLKKDTDNRFGRHLSDEDFYVYLTAHEWRHYSEGGTGIRSLLDCYVYCRAKGHSLDWDYISAQMKQLGLERFEQARKALAIELFSSESMPALNEEQTEMLTYYFASGTYGSLENRVSHEISHQSKTKFILKNLFPSMEYMRRSVRFVNQCPALYPAGLVYRLGCALFRDRKTTIRRIKAVGNNDHKQV